MTNRPLKAGEMFEVVIEKLVERWSGSLEMGVTAIRPEQLDFPSTMTDIDYETWMLSCSSVMQVGAVRIFNENNRSIEFCDLILYFCFVLGRHNHSQRLSVGFRRPSRELSSGAVAS